MIGSSINFNFIIECSASVGFHTNSYSVCASFSCISCVSDSNCSSNYIQQYSALYFQAVYGKCTINFSSICNNHASNFDCLIQNSGNYHDFMLNFVNNTQDLSFEGCIFIDGKATFENCSIIGPFCNGPSFYVRKSNYDGLVNIYNCNLDPNCTFASTGGGTFLKNQNIMTNTTIFLKHFLTYDCYGSDFQRKIDDTYHTYFDLEIMLLRCNMIGNAS